MDTKLPARAGAFGALCRGAFARHGRKPYAKAMCTRAKEQGGGLFFFKGWPSQEGGTGGERYVTVLIIKR